jgi:3-deoxy-manno-octulosonate cytidylyltransferase (CMP-KDO synthetase)
VADFTVVIPARYQSTRFPGKPLALLAGKTMVVHVLERARASGARAVVVATDDRRIAEAVTAAGGEVAMTRADHVSGTDRVHEVVQSRSLSPEGIVLNVQGDEPLIEPEALRAVAEGLVREPSAGMATLATPIRSETELTNPNIVKVVLNHAGFALYFSRAPIPWGRGESSYFLRHVGLYGYRVKVLERLANTPPAALERAESLEQLRALAEGIPIHVTVREEIAAHGVDTPEDLARVEAMLGGARAS